MAERRTEPASGEPASGIIWVYHFREDGTAISVPSETVSHALGAAGGWTWVHIGLADTRARAWIAQHAPISDMAREVLAGPDEHMRLDRVGDEIVGILPDLHLKFERPTEDIVRLRFVMMERILITARRRPAHTLELIRRSIETGRQFSEPVSFLDALVDQFADAIGRLTETMGDQLDQIEDRLLKDELGEERLQLGRLRLQSVRMHRQLAQLYALFNRIEPRVAAQNKPAVRALIQKFDAIDRDVAAQHDRARLLLDEVAGKTAEITNRRLLTLSILTACLLPPTLVTGFFGMNTKDLPFQNVDGGTWYAMLVATAAAALAYWLLTRLRAL